MIGLLDVLKEESLLRVSTNVLTRLFLINGSLFSSILHNSILRRQILREEFAIVYLQQKSLMHGYRGSRE